MFLIWNCLQKPVSPPAFVYARRELYRTTQRKHFLYAGEFRLYLGTSRFSIFCRQLFFWFRDQSLGCPKPLKKEGSYNQESAFLHHRRSDTHSACTPTQRRAHTRN